MADTRPDSTPGTWKLLGDPRLRVRLAVGSLAVLTLGAWLRPPELPDSPPAPAERAAPLLEEQVQRREAVRPFRGVEPPSDAVRGAGVAIPPHVPAIPIRDDYSTGTPVSRPDGYGVFVGTTSILTHGDALDGRSTAPIVTAAGKVLDARLVAYDPATGMVLLETGPPGGTPVPVAESAQRAGTLAIATATWDGREIVAPLFVHRSGGGGSYTIAADEDLPPGMPVFTADGALLAVLGSQDRPRRALGASEAIARLTALAAAGTVSGSIGIAVQDIPAALIAAFGEQGVVVTRVLSGGPADRAGLAAGDVLLGIGGRDLTSAAAASGPLRESTPGTPIALRIRRDGRERGLQATPALAFAVAALARDEGLGPPAGVDARRVLSPAVAGRAGIPGSARVLAVNGTPVDTRGAVDRMLARARTPLPVLVEHEGRRYYAAVEAVP